MAHVESSKHCAKAAASSGSTRSLSTLCAPNNSGPLSKEAGDNLALAYLGEGGPLVRLAPELDTAIPFEY